MVGHPSLESAFLKEAWHPRVPPPEVPPSGLEVSSSLPPHLQWSGSWRTLLTCFLEGLEHGAETPPGPPAEKGLRGTLHGTRSRVWPPVTFTYPGISDAPLPLDCM